MPTFDVLVAYKLTPTGSTQSLSILAYSPPLEGGQGEVYTVEADNLKDALTKGVNVFFEQYTNCPDRFNNDDFTFNEVP